MIVAALLPVELRELRLREPLSREDYARALTELAWRSRVRGRRKGRPPLALISRYIKKAIRMAGAKRDAGEPCEDYELRFLADSHVYLDAMETVRRDLPALGKLRYSCGLPAICGLTALVSDHCPEPPDAAELENAVRIYGSARALEWSELCMLRTAFLYASLGKAAIYASKMLVRRRIRMEALSDIARGKVERSRLRYNTYVKTLYAAGDERFREDFMRACDAEGIDPERVVAEDDVLVASYAPGVDAVTKALRMPPISLERLISLSLSAAELMKTEGAGLLTPETMAAYLGAVEKAARKARVEERAMAARYAADSLKTGKDLAYFVIRPPLSGGVRILQLMAVTLLALFAALPAAFFLAPVAVGIVTAISAFFVYLIVFDELWSYFLGKCVGTRIVPERVCDASPTAIVMCVFVSRVEDVRKAMRDLETLAAANPERTISYGLLLDAREDYASVTEDITSAFGALRDKRRFFACLRSKAWERKRGALMQFGDLVLRHDSSAFRGIWGETGEPKYVITLDSDSILVDARRLVGMMEHPYNADVNVMSLSMRARISSLVTPFARFLCGDKGYSRYACGHSLSFDAYGLGNYTGKGIYRVEAFDKILRYALPENRVLSHDMLEGAYVGCAESGICGTEDHPLCYSSFIARAGRWMRGDLQLLPWLFPFVRNAKGERVRNPLSATARCAVLTGILRVLAPVGSVVLLAVAAVIDMPWLIAVAFARQALGIFLTMLGQSPSPRVFREIAVQIWWAAQMPAYGAMCACCVVVTAVRMMARKGLLTWKTFSPGGSVGAMIPGAVAFGALFAVFGILHMSVALVAVAAVFVSMIPVDIAMSLRDTEPVPREKDVNAMYEIARRTWLYFEETLTERNGHLPCDNYREGGEWADRTSPTNIGMALTSAVCAAELGLISDARRDEIVARVLDALDGLEKYRGCLYNWYRVSDRCPLAPVYVSAVDCGNLLAALLLVSTASAENAEHARGIMRDMDMSFMFDEERGLLRIGYDTRKHEPDDGHYDLLGSEAALTYLTCIACGKLPRASYRALSVRALRAGKGVLASWTGGVFEYMLTPMFFRPPRRSLTGVNMERVALAHIRHARAYRSDITGASESLYGVINDGGDLSYMAFGADEIALSEGGNRPVFAPYARVMLQITRRLRRADVAALAEKYSGRYGLYDSYDMVTGTIQRSVMSHHQGMILLAIANVLRNGRITELMEEDAGVRAASVLTDEPPDALRHARTKRKTENVRPLPDPLIRASERTALPQLDLMTNGRYMLVTDECGRSYAMCDGLLLTRFDDLSGLRVFLEREGEVYEPSVSSVCDYGAFLSHTTSENKGVICTIEATVSGRCNGELRYVNIKNTTSKAIDMSVIICVKPCLTARDADLAHKAFSSMFIETAPGDDGDMVTARRTSPASDLLALAVSEKAEYYGDERYLRSGKGVRFGRTTEPVLAAKVKLGLDPGGSADVAAALMYGTYGNIRAAIPTVFSRASCLYAGGREVAARYAPAHMYRTLAARLMFGKGRTNGALPRVLICVERGKEEEAAHLLRGLAMLRKFGVEFAAVVVYEDVSGYHGMGTRLGGAVSALGEHVTAIRARDLTKEELAALCRECVLPYGVRNELLPPFHELPPVRRLDVALPETVTEYPLGVGGFTSDGGYAFTGASPSPWCNVMSDGKIGCVVSSECGFTFASNSRQEKLTRYYGDPYGGHGDGVVVGEGGTLWSPTRLPVTRDCAYETYHGRGVSRFSCGACGAVTTLTVWVDDGVKYERVEIRNETRDVRTLDVMCFAEAVLGDHIAFTRGGIVCERTERGARAMNGSLGLYLTADVPASDVALTAEAFRDRSGRFRVCSHFAEGGCTPALAYSVRLTLPPEGRAEVVFALSTAPVTVTASSAEQSLRRTVESYADLADVTSDERPICYYLQSLAYQTLVSRFTARCGYWQVGGAIGFRDQLQDAVALIWICSDKVAEHIKLCAEHQFLSGDVLHWWHPPAVGVRTRICDDRLFLAYALCEYVEQTGDRSLLKASAFYLKDRPVPENAPSLYAAFERGDVSESILSHALRAVRSVRLSERGLVLMGGGDWNDGFDKLGEKGRGESVWCSMFLYYVLGKLSAYAEGEDVRYMERTRMKLYAAVRACYTGDRYIRAFDDEGRAIGVEESDECRIDSLVQSWAVISGISAGEEARRVLRRAVERLADDEHKLIKLLDPPFREASDKRVGYIADYPEGVRENGGQYTHAAVWLVWALYEADMTEEADRLLRYLLPSEHARTPEDAERYLREPYVLAGDVYSGRLAGRGGWSWYTGGAGWLYRLIKEKYYGIRVRGDGVSFSPHIPKGKKVRLEVRIPSGRFELEIDGRSEGRWKVYVGGRGYAGMTMPFSSLAGKKVRVCRESR